VLADARVMLLDHGRVSIRSESIPLAEVLTHFAQATGAEVVYEAARPRQLVTVVIEAASPAEAIARLLEGQGLNYALRLDPSGRNVEMLVVTGNGGSGASAVTGPDRSPRSSAPPPAEEAFEPPPGDAEEPLGADASEGEDSPTPPVAPWGEATSPAFASPSPGAPAGAPAGGDPSTYPGLQPAQPQPPVAASYPHGGPASPPIPSVPVYPGPASYPDRR
jgi:hypothetical protein